MHEEARSYFETHIGPTPTNEEGVEVQRPIAEWNKIKENLKKKDSTHLAEQLNNLNSNGTI